MKRREEKTGKRRKKSALKSFSLKTKLTRTKFLLFFSNILINHLTVHLFITHSLFIYISLLCPPLSLPLSRRPLSLLFPFNLSHSFPFPIYSSSFPPFVTVFCPFVSSDLHFRLDSYLFACNHTSVRLNEEKII